MSFLSCRSPQEHRWQLQGSHFLFLKRSSSFLHFSLARTKIWTGPRPIAGKNKCDCLYLMSGHGPCLSSELRPAPGHLNTGRRMGQDGPHRRQEKTHRASPFCFFPLVSGLKHHKYIPHGHLRANLPPFLLTGGPTTHVRASAFP